MRKGLIIFTFLFFVSCVQISNNKSALVQIKPFMIEKFLNQSFPVTERFSIGKVVIKNPQVGIENNKIVLGLDIKVKPLFLSPISGKIYLSGNVAFSEKKKEIYIVEPQIQKLTFKNTDLLKYLPNEGKNMIMEYVRSYISTIPIYRFDKSSLSGRFVKDVFIKKNTLYLKLGF